MSDKKYWQSFGELNNKEEASKADSKTNFMKSLPFEDFDGKGLTGCKNSTQGFFEISWLQYSCCYTCCQL